MSAYIKVCHFTSAHQSQDVRIFVKECRTLSSLGYETHITVPSPAQKHLQGVFFHDIAKKSTHRLARMTQTAYQVYKKAKSLNADLYHFHDPELLPYGLLLKMRGKIVVYDAHEDLPSQIMSKYYIPAWQRKTVSWALRKFENFVARKIDAVITATPEIGKRFDGISRVGCNINNFPILEELYVSEKNWSRKEKKVCYLGGITRIRGIEEMVKAIGQTDANLVLAGRMAPESLKAQLMNDPNWPRIEFLGEIERSRLASAMAGCMAGLVLFHPERNHINSQPNKMFEYMSAGIPVIGSNFPLWREIIEAYDCGICVNPLDPDEIANAIQWIVDHPAEAERMGNNGRKMILETFNWQRESVKLDQLYKQLLSATS